MSKATTKEVNEMVTCPECRQVSMEYIESDDSWVCSTHCNSEFDEKPPHAHRYEEIRMKKLTRQVIIELMCDCNYVIPFSLWLPECRNKFHQLTLKKNLCEIDDLKNPQFIVDDYQISLQLDIECMVKGCVMNDHSDPTNFHKTGKFNTGSSLFVDMPIKRLETLWNEINKHHHWNRVTQQLLEKSISPHQRKYPQEFLNVMKEYNARNGNFPLY